MGCAVGGWLYSVTATMRASRELSAGLEAIYELTRQNKNSIGVKPEDSAASAQ
jgi:hypothetical protein